jgi:hypothetical protein
MKIYILSLLTFLSIIYAFEVLNNSQPKYNRDNWFHWNKNVSGCQNLRHFLLENTSLEPVIYNSEKKCRVREGKWYGAYTDTFFYNSSKLDIDHIVPLSWAASHGAINWSKKKKRQFANDIDNLIAVSRSENRKKGALGLEKYLPPNKKFHCNYIGKFKTVVSKYELNFKDKEITSLKGLTDSCN